MAKLRQQPRKAEPVAVSPGQRFEEDADCTAAHGDDCLDAFALLTDDAERVARYQAAADWHREQGTPTKDQRRHSLKYADDLDSDS